MNRNRKKLHALAIALATPALMLASAGTTLAVPGQGLDVSWTPTPAGLNTSVTTTNKLDGNCTYDATPIGLWAPPYHHSFTLAADGPASTASWFIPVIPLGTTWHTVVRCVDQSNQLTGYFEQTSSY